MELKKLKFSGKIFNNIKITSFFIKKATKQEINVIPTK